MAFPVRNDRGVNRAGTARNHWARNGKRPQCVGGAVHQDGRCAHVGDCLHRRDKCVGHGDDLVARADIQGAQYELERVPTREEVGAH